MWAGGLMATALLTFGSEYQVFVGEFLTAMQELMHGREEYPLFQTTRSILKTTDPYRGWLMHVYGNHASVVVNEGTDRDYKKLSDDLVAGLENQSFLDKICQSIDPKLKNNLDEKVREYLVKGMWKTIPAKKFLNRSESLELLEQASLLLLPNAFAKTFVKYQTLTPRYEMASWFHMIGDCIRLDDPTAGTQTIEAIVQRQGSTLVKLFPKVMPDLLSFWKQNQFALEPVSDVVSASSVIDRAFPCDGIVSGDSIRVGSWDIANLQLLPLDPNTAQSSIGVRLVPSFGTSSIFFVPNIDGGLGAALGVNPRPTLETLKSTLGLRRASVDEAATAIANIYEDNEKDLVTALQPPRVRMWLGKKKLEHTPSDQHGQPIWDQIDKDQRESVPEAYHLLKASGLDKKIPQLMAWDGFAMWLANCLAMTTIMLHMRAATIFDEDYKTDLFDPVALIKALLNNGAKDFPAVWLCSLVGDHQNVSVVANTEIQRNVLEESADDLFA